MADESSIKKILIIEDEVPMAKALEIKFQKVGFDVKVVFNGEDGLSELKTNTFDIALLDLIMPVMDGWSVLESIKDLQLKTKVIVTSNLSQEEDTKKAKAVGAIDFLVKSNESLENIVDRVKKLLNVT